MNRRPVSGQGGFSLLEAIVSMVLIATTGMALLAWINSSLMSLRRVQELERNQQIMRNALAYMEHINPMQTPHGEKALEPYRISWQARPVAPEKKGIGQSLFQLGLYDTQVRISKDGQEVGRFTVRQAGYKQVIEPVEIF